jgi:hypothetical protein
MFTKFIVAIVSGAFYCAVQMCKLLVYGVVYIISAIQDSKKPKPIPAPASPDPALNSPEHKINSLKNQMETEFQLADAYRKKAATEGDGVKRAELRRKAMQADARADALLDKIYKLQGK